MTSKGLLLLILLAGCGSAGRRAGEPEPWPADQPGPFASPTPWHRDSRSGLGVRLVAGEPSRLGQPIPIVVEAMNFGPRGVCIDVQGIQKGCIRVHRTSPGGETPLHLRPQLGQTFQSFVILGPGKGCELDSFDLAERFAIFGPGDYTVQFAGLYSWGEEDWGPPNEAPPGSVVSGVSESAPLRLHIAEGKISLRDRLIQLLYPILPEGWYLCDPGRGADAAEDGRILLDAHGPFYPGTQHHPHFSFSCFPSAVDEKGLKLLGRGPLGGVWIGDVGISLFDGPHPSDACNEKILRERLMPELQRKIVQALQLR